MMAGDLIATRTLAVILMSSHAVFLPHAFQQLSMKLMMLQLSELHK
jgi:hypothetical protein